MGRNWHLSNLYLKKKLIDVALCTQCQGKIDRVRKTRKKMVPTIFEVWESNGLVPETIRVLGGFPELELPKLFTVF